MRRISSLIATGLLLAGCGGGSGAPAEPEPPAVEPVPPPAAANLGGIWEGTITDDSTGRSQYIIGITTELGGARFGSGKLVFGIDANNFSGNVVTYMPRGFVGLDGNTVWNGTIAGQLVERQSVIFSYDIPGRESGRVAATYNAGMYERGSSYARIEGTWSGANKVITVDPDGTFHGQESSGCVLNGRFRVLDTQFNAYTVSLDLGNCGSYTGRFVGLAFTEDHNRLDIPNEDARLRFLSTGPANEYNTFFDRD